MWDRVVIFPCELSWHFMIFLFLWEQRIPTLWTLNTRYFKSNHKLPPPPQVMYMFLVREGKYHMQIPCLRFLSVETQMACPFYICIPPCWIKEKWFKKKRCNGEICMDITPCISGCLESQALCKQNGRCLENCFSLHFCSAPSHSPWSLSSSSCYRECRINPQNWNAPSSSRDLKAAQGNIRLLLELLQGMSRSVIAFDQFLPVVPLKCFVHRD